MSLYYARFSKNGYRTIFSCIFNFCKKREKYDKNPVQALREWDDSGNFREVFLTPAQLAAFLAKCDELGDKEVKAFTIIGCTTGARRTEQLSRTWRDVRLEAAVPHIYVPRTKNGRPKYLPLTDIAVAALKDLPSYGTHEYVYPARPNPRFQSPVAFKKPHAWDLGKRWRRIARLCGLRDDTSGASRVECIRVHDLRHFTATELSQVHEIDDKRISRLTGHRSDELERYINLQLSFKKRTVDLIGKSLEEEIEKRRNGNAAQCAVSVK